MNSGAQSGHPDPSVCAQNQYYEIVCFLGSLLWAHFNVEADQMGKDGGVVVCERHRFIRKTQDFSELLLNPTGWGLA